MIDDNGPTLRRAPNTVPAEGAAEGPDEAPAAQSGLSRRALLSGWSALAADAARSTARRLFGWTDASS